MKRLILLSSMIACLSFGGNAQEITDKHVWRYALMMETIGQMKSELSAKVNDLIKKQEGMTGQRYKELDKGATPANDFEKQFMETVNKVKDKQLKAIKTVNSNLATKMLGSADIYKAVKAAVKADKKDLYEQYKQQIAFGD